MAHADMSCLRLAMALLASAWLGYRAARPLGRSATSHSCERVNGTALSTRAARLLGNGALGQIVDLPVDDLGRVLPEGLSEELKRSSPPRRRSLILQAGDINTGACDPFESSASHRQETYDAWVHVDGAFGLWAAASPELEAPGAKVSREPIHGPRTATSG